MIWVAYLQHQLLHLCSHCPRHCAMDEDVDVGVLLLLLLLTSSEGAVYIHLVSCCSGWVCSHGHAS